MTHRIISIVAFASLLAFAGCTKTETPVAPGTYPAGFVLKENGTEKARQGNGSVTGSVDVKRPIGSGGQPVASGDMDITFTNTDGSAFTMHSDDSLDFVITNQNIVGVQRIAGERFKFRFLGKGAGQSTVKFVLLRNHAPLFTTAPIDAHIVTEGLEVVKMTVTSGTGLNLSVLTLTDSTVIGGVISPSFVSGTHPLRFQLFDANGTELDTLGKAGITLVGKLADTSVADFVPDPSISANFNLLPKKVDSTTIVFQVRQNTTATGDYVAFQSLPVKVKVH
ncbi:MAG: hypothetical protein ABIR47_07185 [Candidatus Kapaibacterium sp.]